MIAPHAGVSTAAQANRPRGRSFDAWVMTAPSRAFAHAARQPSAGGWWIAVRRPLFVTAVLGCGMSVLAAGVVTPRIAAPSTFTWAFVPLAEILGLLAAVRRRPRHTSLAAAIDVFFAGHAPWVLFMLVFAGVMASVHPVNWWMLLTRAAVAALVVTLVWSAFIDFQFFRVFLGATRRRALADVLLSRLVVWTIVFAIFAVPSFDPKSLAAEIDEVVMELLR